MKEKLITEAIDKALPPQLIESLWRLYDEEVPAIPAEVAVFLLKEKGNAQAVEVELKNKVVVTKEFAWRLLGWPKAFTGVIWIGNDETQEIMTFPKMHEHKHSHEHTDRSFEIDFMHGMQDIPE
jgi:hypothetical protein